MFIRPQTDDGTHVAKCGDGFDRVEPYFTLREAARALNLTYVQVQRAVRRGILPSYRPFGRRPLVRLSEISAVIAASREGGSNE